MRLGRRERQNEAVRVKCKISPSKWIFTWFQVHDELQQSAGLWLPIWSSPWTCRYRVAGSHDSYNLSISDILEGTKELESNGLVQPEDPMERNPRFWPFTKVLLKGKKIEREMRGDGSRQTNTVLHSRRILWRSSPEIGGWKGKTK